MQCGCFPVFLAFAVLRISVPLSRKYPRGQWATLGGDRRAHKSRSLTAIRAKAGAARFGMTAKLQWAVSPSESPWSRR